ncbi:hypothetical protein JHK85_018540 [Glycine max]|nr:hypothetical protein JHK85_018540 [Glycine max]
MRMFVPLIVTITALVEGRDLFIDLLITIFFLVEDYTNYWFHMFLHNNWGDEKIHGVHHEAGGILRLLFYVLASPIVVLLYYFIFESADIQGQLDELRQIYEEQPEFLEKVTFGGLPGAYTEGVVLNAYPKCETVPCED